jgi:thiamine biosynthesis lipoprotein
VTDALVHTVAAMGTVVTFHVVGHAGERAAAVARAVAWFEDVERACTRFDPGSEIMRLGARVGVSRPSDLLFEVIRFSLALAEETNGAFDPTLGHYGVVAVDDHERTVTLHAPVVFDLGAVAKGLAIDLASRELQPFENFAIDAGGDLYLGGVNAAGEPWSVGIRDPHHPNAFVDTLRVSDAAVCTSATYERGDHILDPRRGRPAGVVASVTVIAPNAMAADALSTAAFVLGDVEGRRLLERHGVTGVFVA